MPRKDAAADLASQLVQTLETQRALGPEWYPARLDQLAGRLDPPPAPALVLKATGKLPFKERVLLAKKHLEAPLAFVEDIEHLVGSDRLLEFALGLACGPARPTAAVTTVASKVDKRLKEPFAAALRQRLQDHRLPDGIEALRVGRAEHLHPLRWPLPKKPEVELAERLLDALRAQDAQADFLSLEQLLARTELRPRPAVLNKVLADKQFREQVLVPLPRVRAAPVALRQQRERLFVSPALLRLLLQTQRKPTEQVIAVRKLASKLPKEERQVFIDAVHRGLDADQQPAGLGWIWSGKQRCLLLLTDLHGQQLPAPSAPVATADFPALFEQAFGVLDQQGGEHNFVKLTELRRAIPVPRATFDAGLRELRRAGRYSLSAAEGRHGLTAEEREASLIEDGSLLLYVSRRER